jgi:hypothetical protein
LIERCVASAKPISQGKGVGMAQLMIVRKMIPQPGRVPEAINWLKEKEAQRKSCGQISQILSKSLLILKNSCLFRSGKVRSHMTSGDPAKNALPSPRNVRLFSPTSQYYSTKSYELESDPNSR